MFILNQRKQRTLEVLKSRVLTRNDNCYTGIDEFEFFQRSGNFKKIKLEH